MFKNFGRKIKKAVKKVGRKVRKVSEAVSRKIHGRFLINVNPTIMPENIAGLTHVDFQIRRNCFVLLGERDIKERIISCKIFPRYTSSKQAIEKMKEKGCRPATFLELLSVISHPEKIPKRFRRKALVALGSFYENSAGEKQVAALTLNDSHRDLDPMDIEKKWPPHFRFLAVYEKDTK